MYEASATPQHLRQEAVKGEDGECKDPFHEGCQVFSGSPKTYYSRSLYIIQEFFVCSSTNPRLEVKSLSPVWLFVPLQIEKLALKKTSTKHVPKMPKRIGMTLGWVPGSENTCGAWAMPRCYQWLIWKQFFVEGWLWSSPG